MLRHKLWHASQTVWQLNLEAVSLHAYPSLPATPLACDHDHGDRSRDRMRGLRDAGQHAAAPDCDGDGAGRQRLQHGGDPQPSRVKTPNARPASAKTWWANARASSIG